jgi:antitoxin HicB
MVTKKKLQYYLNLPWTYTIEQDTHKGKRFYIINVNELPGICTDAPTIEEGMELIKESIAGAIELYLKNGEVVPEPIKKEDYKGNIAYRTTSERHYRVSKFANQHQQSLSKTLDELIDIGMGTFLRTDGKRDHRPRR